MHIAGAETNEGRIDLLLEAIAEADEASERAQLLLDLSELLERDQGDPERALTSARAALEEVPELAAAAGRVADLMESLGQYSDLADFLTDRLEGAHATRDGRAVMARRVAELAERRLADPARAIAGWRVVLVERPGDREALQALARLYRATGALRDRMPVLLQLVDCTEGVSARAALHRELAAGYQDLGQIEAAAEHLEWALAVSPGSPEDHHALAATYLAMGRVHAAIDAQVRRADLLTGVARAEVLLEIAALYEGARRDPGRAIDFCAAALAADPDHVGALRALARLHEQLEDHESAARVLELWASCPDAGPPAERAELLARAGRIARDHLADEDEAARLFDAALAVDATSVPALRGRAELCEARGEHRRAARMVMDAVAACELDGERAALACWAGELHEQLGDLGGAIAFYRDALDSEPRHRRAAAHLAEILWAEEHYGELVGVLELLAGDLEGDEAVTALERLAHCYRALSLDRRALVAVRRARTLAAGRRDLALLEADLCVRCKQWGEASRALEALVDAPAPSATSAERISLLHRAGVAAARAGNQELACRRLREALALDPGHRESLVELSELVSADPRARLAVLRALAAGATGAERCEVLVEIGDLLAGRADERAEAIAAYREALALAPADHIIIHKCLDLLAEERRWDECRDLFQRLIDTEQDPPVRAKARHAAAILCRDEMDRPEEAIELLWAALDDDPDLQPAREGLEEMLRGRGAWQALANLYLKLLAHHGREAEAGGEPEDPRIAAERVRLWSQLGEVCWTHLGQRDGALEAFEVAHRLAPDDLDRLRDVAERAAEAGPQHRARALAAHQELVARSKQRVASYHALAALYQEAGLDHHARACSDAEAFAALGADPDARPRPDRSSLALGERELTAEMWTGLAHPSEEPVVSALFALLAPVVAGAAALSRKRLVLELRGAEPLPDDSVAGRVLARVAASLGVARPEALACAGRRAALEIRIVADRGAVRPVLVLGAPLLSGATERTVAFHLGRALAALRGGGILRTALPRPEQLAHLIEAAMEMARGGARPATGGTSGLSVTIRTLERGLTPLQREQLVALGARLAGGTLLAETAARDWLRAHDLSIARVGLVACGDLATAAEVLRGDPPSAGHHPLGTRLQEMVWSSATEPVLEARGHLEGWYAPDEPAARSAV